MHCSFLFRARALVFAVGLVTVVSVGVPARAAPVTPQTVETVVTAKLLDQAERLPVFADAGASDTRVTVLRREGRWAYGTAVLVAPERDGAYPQDWLFVAELRHGRWRLAFDGEPAFPTLSARSPVVSPDEKRIFASHGGQVGTQANGDYRTGMRLPYAIGQSWSLLGGPHAYDAGTGPWSSVDLAGGDQRVLAARSGVAYTPCVGLIRVDHANGYTTRYYHLWNHLRVNGASVAAGAFLGDTGTEVGCGGSARSRHVHFSLLQNGSFVGIANHIIGKWVFMNGGAQYGGHALHGSTRIDVGGALYNYGPLGSTQGIVDTNGGTTLNKRTGPGTGYALAGTVTDGATVSISCSKNGTTHTGRWGTTSLWNRLTDGTWVSDAFLATGLDGPVNSWC